MPSKIYSVDVVVSCAAAQRCVKVLCVGELRWEWDSPANELPPVDRASGFPPATGFRLSNSTDGSIGSIVFNLKNVQNYM